MLECSVAYFRLDYVYRCMFSPLTILYPKLYNSNRRVDVKPCTDNPSSVAFMPPVTPAIKNSGNVLVQKYNPVDLLPNSQQFPLAHQGQPS